MSELLDWTFRGKRSTSGRQVKVKGFGLNSDGRLVKDQRRLDVSTRLKQKASKRVRVKRGGA